MHGSEFDIYKSAGLWLSWFENCRCACCIDRIFLLRVANSKLVTDMGLRLWGTHAHAQIGSSCATKPITIWCVHVFTTSGPDLFVIKNARYKCCVQRGWINKSRHIWHLPGVRWESHCNTLQHTAARYKILLHTATHCNKSRHISRSHVPYKWVKSQESWMKRL